MTGHSMLGVLLNNTGFLMFYEFTRTTINNVTVPGLQPAAYIAPVAFSPVDA